MNLKLGKNARVISDGPGLALQARKVSKTHKEYWRPDGYYACLTDAAVAAVRKHLLDSEEELAVGDLIVELRRVGHEVSAACHAAPSRVKQLVRPCDAKKLEAMLEAAVRANPEV